MQSDFFMKNKQVTKTERNTSPMKIIICCLILIILVIFLIEILSKNESDSGRLFRLNEEFELGVKEKTTCPEEELTIKVESIISEDIVSAPGNEEAYPVGNGVTVNLTVLKGNTSKKIELYLLSQGYESKITENWNGYKITLIDASEKVKLKVEKVN